MGQGGAQPGLLSQKMTLFFSISMSAALADIVGVVSASGVTFAFYKNAFKKCSAPHRQPS